MFHSGEKYLFRLAGLFQLGVISTAVAACGGGGTPGGDGAKNAQPAAAACSVPSDSIIGNSLDKFIATRDPVPYRFLITMVGENAIPEPAQWAVNTLNRVPYVWPTDPKLQEKQIGDMRAKTPLPMIALFYHGHSRLPDGRFQTEFSGEYHDFRNSGKKIPRTAVFFDCSAAGADAYRVADEAPKPETTAPKTDTTTGKSLN